MLTSIEGNFENPEVNKLLTKHFIELRAASPKGSAHVLDIPGLKVSSIKFWSLWENEKIFGCGALKFLEKEHGEFKSIRIHDEFKNKGNGIKDFIEGQKDVYEANGISIPKTYDEFLDNCKKLKAKGIASVAIGTKYLWTAAGWFDYINMRTNGLDYHINLMLGKTKYTDQGVVNTFKNWARAIDAGCFMDDHQNYSWQEAQPPLINGEAASYLIGNFIVNNLPEETQAQLDFYQFPPIDPSLELGEDAPTEIIFMPANAQNVENGKKFMAFFAQPENLTAMNNVLGQLSTHSGSAAPSDRFQRAGAEMLSKSKTAQFFDRDTTPEMAKAAMQLMVDFMLEPENMMEILEEIEEERSRIFGG